MPLIKTIVCFTCFSWQVPDWNHLQGEFVHCWDPEETDEKHESTKGKTYLFGILMDSSWFTEEKKKKLAFLSSNAHILN